MFSQLGLEEPCAIDSVAFMIFRQDIGLQAVNFQQRGRMHTRCGRVSLDLWSSIRASKALTLLKADNHRVNGQCLRSTCRAANYGL
jgi:hypothetical protein